jgi:hypothetical protein
MKQTQQTHEPWRDGIISILKAARYDEERNLKSSEPSQDEVLLTLLEEAGGDKLITQMDEHRKKADATSEELRKLGFMRDGRSNVELAYDAPASLKTSYRKACNPNDGTNQKSLKKFDLATVRVLAAETADKAREIAESVIA